MLRRIDLKFSKKRGFIAAPLIGTIIFLTAIVFIVNINKSETNNIAKIASDAYHTRVTSIVELYRGDSGAMFREDLRKVIESALTSQCWSSFSVRVDAPASSSKQEKVDALKIARFETCSSLTRTIHTLICSNDGRAVSAQCIEEKTAAGLSPGDALQQCRQEEGAVDNSEYGLQNWLANVMSEFTFEGITLEPTGESVRKFTENYQASGERGFALYQDTCKKLISGVKVDCSAFASNYLSNEDSEKFKCCSVDTELGQTCNQAGGIELPGCESGTFYVEVSPSSVFDTLPRIQADAGQGNVIVAGALSDREKFNLLINFPVLKYYDSAYRFYYAIAFGANGPKDGQALGESNRGVLDGTCFAGRTCSNREEGQFLESFPKFYGSNGDIAKDFDDAAEEAAVNIFYDDLLVPAMKSAVEGSEGLSLGFAPNDGGIISALCTFEDSSFTCNERSLKDRLKVTIEPVGIEGGKASAISKTFFYQMKFIDKDPRFKIDKDKHNEFCWYASAEYSAN